MKNLKLLGVLLVGLFLPILVNAEACIENCVVQIGDTKFATVQEAITAVEDGGTIELLAGEITDEINTGRIDKSFTIVGAANYATMLTGGLTIGTDHSSKPVQEYTVTIKGIAFKNKGIAVKDVKNVNIEDNKLDNVSGEAAIYIIDPAIQDVESDVVVKNNVVNGANQGIRIRTGYNMEITGNIVKNTQHNSITIEHGSKWSGNKGTVVINNNTFENWALGGEGRVVRAHFGTAIEFNKVIAFTGNKMISNGEVVEEYAKLTGVGTIAVDFEKNYWNNDTPDFDKIILVEGGNKTVEISEYYYAETMQDKDLNTYVEPPKIEEPKTEVPVVNEDNTIGVSNALKTENILLDTLAQEDKYKDLSVTVEVVVEDIEVEENIDKEFNEALAEDDKKDGKILSYFDITIAVRNSLTEEVEGYLTELTEKVEFKMALPELDEVEEGYTRRFYVIKKHGTTVSIIEAKLSSDGKYIIFETDEFSTYALAYEDTLEESNDDTIVDDDSDTDDKIEETEKDPTISGEGEKEPEEEKENETEDKKEETEKAPTMSGSGDKESEKGPEDTKEENIEVPQTFDGITTTLILGFIALISFVGLSFYFKKELAKKNN